MEPEKKTPEEEKKPAPAAEQKDEPKPFRQQQTILNEQRRFRPYKDF